MSKEMRCCHKLPGGVKRAFFCKQCSKATVILCEDCATFCHPFHEVAQIPETRLGRPLFCDCGNERAPNELCLMNSTKQALNAGNVYFFRHLVPEFTLEYNDRRCELLSKSGNHYMDRATRLAARSCFLASMEDVNTAIAWDCEKVEAKILEIEVGPFVEVISKVASDFVLSIQNMDLSIMNSVELVMRFCKRVRSACNQAKQKAENSDDLVLLIESFQDAEQSILVEFWRRASSFDEIYISSILQFDVYKKHVVPLRNHKAFLHLILKAFNRAEFLNIITKVKNSGFEYEILSC